MDPQPTLRTRLTDARDGLRRATAAGTAGGVMLVGLPLAMDYVVRPGDTLSEIALSHDTTVDALVQRNGLHRSGDRIMAGQSLNVPAAHARPRTAQRRHSATAAPRTGGDGISPDARRIVSYTVRSGDTPSGLAVRFHAWTAELVEMNGPLLRVGERIRIPVVVAAVAAERRTASNRRDHGRTAARQAPSGTGPSRDEVRRVISATARRNGVDPDLALAVSWQEAGWQMHHRSSVGAIGAMQVMPSTGRWMSQVVGRRLHLRDLDDNAVAGVVLLRLLEEQAPTRMAVAGYYQGLAGVRRHGMYRDTKRYVANVLALRDRFQAGQYPG